MSPIILCSFLILLRAALIPPPLGIGCHLDEQRVPFLQDAKGSANSLGYCPFLLLVERVRGVRMADLAAKPQA